MSQEQRAAIDQLLREAPLDLGGDVGEQRAIFEEMMAATPVPPDVTATPGTLGAIPVVTVDVAGTDASAVILYLHGGAYAIGSAAESVGLASDLSRRAGTRLISVDYRLAPEHPYPAGLEDAVAAYRGLLDSGLSASRIAIAGESAGGGARRRDARGAQTGGPRAADECGPDVPLGRPHAVGREHDSEGCG